MTDLLRAVDWQAVRAELDGEGCAVVPGLLPATGCNALAALYGESGAFRRRVAMGAKGYGRGEYQYFDYPLPAPVDELRRGLYPPLARIANDWCEALGLGARFPSEHHAYLAQCHRAGQSAATPLLLRYAAGDFNCLHQDLYGKLVFPLQVTLLLSRPGADFDGGEFVMTIERDSMQVQPRVVPLNQGARLFLLFISAPSPRMGRLCRWLTAMVSAG